MEKTKILVVEDESIVAKDIQNTLIKLGYDVPATAFSALTAFDRLDEIKPDLVFLDIKLKGDLDGIQIAERIKTEYDIPVIFLTSYVDKSTLDRAKVTEPYGYLVKPFNENDLQTTVEMAVYKSKKDRSLRYDKAMFAKALSHLEESVIITDSEGKITFINQRAENLLGFGNESAAGKTVSDLVHFESPEFQVTNSDQLKKVISENRQITIDHAKLSIPRTQSSAACSLNSSPIRDEKNQVIGVAFVIRQSGSQPADSDAGENEKSDPLPFENLVIQNSFFVRKGSMLIKVYLENIQWIQAMDNYVIIQTNTDQFIVHSTMRDIEMKMPAKKFLRVHRSYIIPIDKISVLDENSIVIGDKTIPIGKSYKDAFMERLNFL